MLGCITRHAAARQAVDQVVSHAVGQAASAASRPALTAGARLTPPAATGARAYVSDEALGHLRKVRIGEAAVQAYSLQRPHRCWDNTASMHRRIVDRLVDQQVLTRHPLQSWLRPFDPDQGLKKIDAVKSAKNPEGVLTLDIVKSCLDERGVIHLTGFNALQPGQGGEGYTDFHSCVLLGIFNDAGGRPVGLVVDGNDRQDNPAMRELRRLMTAQGDTRPLSALQAKDFEHYARLAFERQGNGEDPRQMAFRFVRIDDWLAAGQAAQPLVLAVDAGTTRLPSAPKVISDPEALRVTQLLRDDPSLVEPSTPPKQPPAKPAPAQGDDPLLHFPLEALPIP